MADKTQNAREILEPLGERIRTLRIKKGWSQLAMAKVAGMHANHLGQIERGELDSSMDVLFRISTAFNITLSNLFKGIF